MRFFERKHGIYFDDLDAFAILHNARYLLLFEHAIGSFWQHTGWGWSLDFETEPDRHHLVRTNHVEYLRPVVGTGEVRLRLWVKKLGRTSLTFGFRVMPMDQDIDHAVGERVIVKVDRETKRPTPWSDEFRAKVEDYRADVDA